MKTNAAVSFRSFLILAAFHFATLAYAAPHRVIDLKVKTDADGVDREVSFCARPSPDTTKNLPGHAFVAFSQLFADGKRTYIAIGHTTNAPPGNAMLTYTGLIPSVDGYLNEEKYTSAKSECLVVRVNKEAFEAALALIKGALDAIIPNPTDRPKVLLAYRLGESDCMGFMTSVAKVFANDGLKVPQRGATEMPLKYMRRMIEEN